VALPLPEWLDEIPLFLRHVWAFDRARVTEEDRRRAELYAERAERVRAERSAASLEEFLAGLRLEVKIAGVEPHQMARVAQLTLRTNQMNNTCVRRGEPEIAAMLREGSECLVVDVRDRFGSYGLTGAMLFQAAADALRVESFLLSCRALGRGVEHRMVVRLGEIALERNLARVEIPFVACQRNRPAALFLESLRPAGPDGVFRLPAGEAARVKYRAGQAAAAPAAQPLPHPKTAPHRPDYVRIATELRDPAAVAERIRAAASKPLPEGAGAEPPRTPLERDLAELWAALLNVRAVGVHDNFFDLGGHSLLAVQLLSRVRQIYGVELSLEVVYSGEFTVAELAKAIELKEIEQSGGRYEDLIAEIDHLSDDEVRALLAEEQNRT
jgi:acyl carrier protein